MPSKKSGSDWSVRTERLMREVLRGSMVALLLYLVAIYIAKYNPFRDFLSQQRDFDHALAFFGLGDVIVFFSYFIVRIPSITDAQFKANGIEMPSIEWCGLVSFVFILMSVIFLPAIHS